MKDALAGESITTWMGDHLGMIVHAGRVWQSNFGDKRRYVRIQAINGRIYSGVAQLSNGTYVRMREVAK